MALVSGAPLRHLAAMTAASRSPRRRAPRKVSPAYLERAALAHLSRYASTTANLRRLLMRRIARSVEAHGTDPDEAATWLEEVLAKLARLGYLDDAAYALAKARYLLRHGKPVRTVRAGLAAKGVPPEIIDETLAALADEGADLDLAAAVAFARRRRLGPFGAGEARNHGIGGDKALAAFARAGFSYAVARRVLEAPDRESLEAELSGGEAA